MLASLPSNSRLSQAGQSDEVALRSILPRLFPENPMNSTQVNCPLRVLVVGTPSTCRSLVDTLNDPSVEVVGRVHTLDDAVYAAAVLAPHFALLDEGMSEAAHLVSEWTNAVIIPTPTADRVPRAKEIEECEPAAGFLEIVIRLATVAPPRALASGG